MCLLRTGLWRWAGWTALRTHNSATASRWGFVWSTFIWSRIAKNTICLRWAELSSSNCLVLITAVFISDCQVSHGATAFFPPGSSLDQQGSVLVRSAAHCCRTSLWWWRGGVSQNWVICFSFSGSAPWTVKRFTARSSTTCLICNCWPETLFRSGAPTVHTLHPTFPTACADLIRSSGLAIKSVCLDEVGIDTFVAQL